MKPIAQEIVNIQTQYNTCMVKSSKGNIYPVDLNHYCKNIEVGDIALVTKSINGEWLLVDVENKHTEPLDITDFPRDNDGCLNWIAYCQYLDAIEDMSVSKRMEFDNYLKAKWEVSQ